MNMPLQDRIRLDGQVALVTGGGGGIGRAIALRLAEAGAHIAIADIVPERCDEVAERVREMGRETLPRPTDVMDTDQVRAFVAEAAETFGRIDILINNAGGVSGRPFLDQSEGSWRRHIDINMLSMLAATSAAVPVMIAGAEGGSIVNVSSIEAARAAPGFAVYAACKAGMNSFTRTMAVELAEHDIRVNCIAPDHTVTPGTRGNRTGPLDEAAWTRPAADAQDAMDRLIPLGREGIDGECGDAALFLCTQLASYVTGTILPVDGGTWAASGWVRDPDGDWTLNQGLKFVRGSKPE